MSGSGWLLAAGATFAGGAWLVASGWRQPRPPLAAVIARLHAPAAGGEGDGWDRRWIRWVARNDRARLAGARWAPSLRLVGRSPEAHVALLVAASLIGFVVPVAVGALSGVLGVVAVAPAVPLALSVVAAAAGPAVVHADAMGRAGDVRVDVRYQLSAFLDVVVMLLAGNTGHEGALQQAARAGDGVLFRQLRRRMREVGTTGHSLVEALSLTAADLDLVELEQVAATTSLSAAQGAPVSRTLAAKCATLRNALTAEQEAEARVRTDKVTPPLVGMALLFMALIIYPALNLN